MSRLRNRIRKADYFTDGELLRWPRDKRTTYTGLWAIAEDSGCLEDDPFSWKLLIWSSPLDADITVEVLAQWRDEMVEAGKLIPYEAEGKSFLYIRTFHQHECPRNPQKNDLPLPEWLKRDSVEGTSKDGKRWVRYRYRDSQYSIDPRYEVCTDSISHPLPCPEYLKVHRGGRNGRGAKAPAPPVPAEQEPERICWRCGKPISGDDVMDDKCVLSRKGLRHKECGT